MNVSKKFIEKCISGDQKAQRELVEQSAPQLMRIALRYTHDEPTAKDVLQDSFIKIFRKLNTYDSNRGKLMGWMRRITINTAIEKYRRKYWKQETPLLDIHHKIEHKQVFKIDQLDLEKIYDLINSLPIGYRTVFNLNVIEGYSHVEIGNMLGISDSTSRSQLKRARKLLQEKLIKLEIV